MVGGSSTLATGDDYQVHAGTSGNNFILMESSASQGVGANRGSCTPASIPSTNAPNRNRIRIYGDTLDEPNETIIATLLVSPFYTARGVQPHATNGVATFTIIDDDPTVVTLARTGTGAVTEGGAIEFTVTLGRRLIAGEIIDVPLVLSGTNITKADLADLAVKSGTSTGVTLIDADELNPVVRFTGAGTLSTSGVQTATLELDVEDDGTSDDGETLSVALGPDGTGTNGFDHSTRWTNVGGGADPHATAAQRAFSVTLNDPPPTVQFARSDIRIAEENATARVALELANAGAGANYALTVTAADGTATKGVDYPADATTGFSQSGYFGFARTNAAPTIPVPITEDTVDEPDETFTLTLSAPTAGVRLGARTVNTVTIRDNDPTIVTLARTDSGAETEGSGTIEFTVSLGRRLIAGEIIDVPLVLSGTNITKADLADLAVKSGTSTGVTLVDEDELTPVVRFTGAGTLSTSGVQTATLELEVEDDGTVDDGETLSVALGPDSTASDGFQATGRATNVGGGAEPSGTAAERAFTVTLNDTPPTPKTLSVSVAASAPEGNTGHADKLITVTISPPAGPSGADFDLCLSGTATRGASGDYQVVGASTGNVLNPTGGCFTVSESSGASSVTRYALRIFGDTDVEADETVVLTLQRNAHSTADLNVSSTAGTATYTIQDDDGIVTVELYHVESSAPPSPPVIPSSFPCLTCPRVVEGQRATWAVRSDRAPSRDLAVRLNVADYNHALPFAQRRERTVTIPAGQTEARFDLVPLDDAVNTGWKHIGIQLGEGTGYVLRRPRTVEALRVLDDDAGAVVKPTVSWVSASPNPVREGKPVTLTARLSHPRAERVGFYLEHYAVSRGERAADVTVPPRLWFEPGETEARATIATLHDLDLADERYGIRLSAVGGRPEGVTIEPPAAIEFGVTDIDEPVAVSFARPAFDVREGVDQWVSVRFDLDPAPREHVTIRYRFDGGTATRGGYDDPNADFAVASTGPPHRPPYGSITLFAGTRRAAVPLYIVDDAVEDSGETIVLTLVEAPGYVVGRRPRATVTIRNDEPGSVSGTLKLSGLSDAQVDENARWRGQPTAAGATGTVLWTLAGADAKRFSIDAATGAVTLPAQDYEAPKDADGNNVYEAAVIAADEAGQSAHLLLRVRVRNVADGGQADKALAVTGLSDATVEEHTVWTGKPAATGATGKVTWTLSGADAGLFSIDAATGAVTLPAQDALVPRNADLDNVYKVTVTAADAGGASASVSFTVTVTAAVTTNNGLFVVTGLADGTVEENAAWTARAGFSGITATGKVTWTLTGADAGVFAIDAKTGALTLPAQDYEAPRDADGDNVYEATATATDAGGTKASASFRVTVTDVADGGPTQQADTLAVTGLADARVAENAAWTAAPSVTGASGKVTWALTGADASLFAIDAKTGALSLPAQDHEAPRDADGDNVYEATVTATDSATPPATASVSFKVTVTDDAEAVTSTEPDRPVSRPVLDEATHESLAFSWTPVRGATVYKVFFWESADKEGTITRPAPSTAEPAFTWTGLKPATAYTVRVHFWTKDGYAGGRLASPPLQMTTLAEPAQAQVPLAVSGLADATVAENAAWTATPTATGGTGAVTWALSGADANVFSIDAATGAVTLAAQDYEAPADADKDNVYEATVTATDAGGATASVSFRVTVLDTAELQEPKTLSLSVTPSAPEGDAGHADHAVQVTLSEAHDKRARFHVCFEGTATPGEDYDVWVVHKEVDAEFKLDAVLHQASQQEVLCMSTGIDAGSTVAFEEYDLVVRVRGDAAVEPDETVVFKLAWYDDLPAGISVAADSATLVIANDDALGITVAGAEPGGSPVEATVRENAEWSAAPEAVSATGQVAWALSGADADVFAIDAATGALTLPAQDFEAPADADGNNVYEATVTATDESGATASVSFRVTVTDVVADEAAQAWWAALGVDARVRALHGEVTDAGALAQRKTEAAPAYGGLADEVRAEVDAIGAALAGAEPPATAEAWWQGLDCAQRRIAVGDGNAADAASPWCGDWPGQAQDGQPVLDDAGRAEALRIARALFGEDLEAEAPKPPVVACPGPNVCVHDAATREAPGATLDFVIEIGEAQARDVAGLFTTRGVTAFPNVDFELLSGLWRIRAGETRTVISVPVMDDAHDEGTETMELLVVRAFTPGIGVADGVGVGAIENTDAMPKAWLGRLGRTVAEQVLDGVAGRIAAERAPGVEATLGGQALPSIAFGPDGGAANGNAAHEEAARRMADIARRFDAGTGSGAGHGAGRDPHRGALGRGTQWRGMTGRELLLGSSFALTGEADGSGGTLAFWGRAAENRFDGREDDLSLDGDVTTGLLGADYARGRWLVGLALSRTDAQGGASGKGSYEVEASLTAATAYGGWRASERLKLWGAAGHGRGELALKPERDGAMETDIDWSMAALGARGELLQAAGSGPLLALVSDALWARTASEEVTGLEDAEAGVTRLRLGLEGSWAVALDRGGSVEPRLTLGGRHDGGDAETGFGVEIGGGVAWSAPALGLTVDIEGRTLLAHEADGLKDRGYSASLAFDPRPGTDRGPSLSLRQDWGGQASGGLGALFAADPLEDRAGSEATSRWTLEAAWGFAALGDRFTASPHAGLGLAQGSRDYTIGWRLAPAAAAAPNLSLGLEATRRETDGAETGHHVGVEMSFRW